MIIEFTKWDLEFLENSSQQEQIVVVKDLIKAFNMMI